MSAAARMAITRQETALGACRPRRFAVIFIVNLYPAELTKLERAEPIAEWIRLTDQKRIPAQVEPKLSVLGRSGEAGKRGDPKPAEGDRAQDADRDLNAQPLRLSPRGERQR
jgi:hypothetical protein